MRELELATELAVTAGRLQVERRATVVVRGSKAHANDLVSDVDEASEALIVTGLLAAFPRDGVLGEKGAGVAGTSGRRWVVDPLDGTRNYLTGAGPWSVSIALEGSVAVVHDPVAGETFSAVAGRGAMLDGAPITTSGRTCLAEAVVGLSFNPSPETRVRMARLIAELLPAVGDIRRYPAALALAYLAAGRIDAALVVDTRIWDVAAGLLIAAEAGVDLGAMPTPELTVAAAPGVAAALSALRLA
jgi:myo-inositol-1(or 4)-monophosphatase